MPKHVLGHDLKGEGARLALMSELLDPMHRRYIDHLDVVKPGARTLEVGCGNGSISAWLAEQVSPGGTAVAVDLDLSLVDARAPNLGLRQADILAARWSEARSISSQHARCCITLPMHQRQ
jgi:protein-L-isoaspartate O-methyltransferase